MLNRLLAVVGAALLFASSASAQIVTPTTRYALAWDHPGTGVDHYEVRYRTTDAWTNVGKAKTATAPLLTVGAYSAQVRACGPAVAAAPTCSATTTLAFTVAAPKPPLPPPVPTATTSLTLGLIAPTPDPDPVPIPDPIPQPAGTVLFQNGWETGSGAGCSNAILRDGVWDDYGPADACAKTPPDAQIVTTEHADGARSLQVTQKPGQNGAEQYNGTDFRMGHSFSSQQELDVLFYVKYASNWVWAAADHKIIIVMGPNYAQNIYLNVRGHGNGSPGYIVVHDLPADTRFDASSDQMSVGVWHKVELHVTAGAHGKIEVKVDDVKTPFPSDNGAGRTILDTNTGTSFDSFKLDTTYNAGASIPYLMNMFYDAFLVRAGKGSF